jgi:hypothetical protein
MGISVPEGMMYAISYDPTWQKQDCIDSVFESLKGNTKRDWFVDHAYHCLPLVIGNQCGFVVKSLYDFEATWNGGNTPQDVVIKILTNDSEHQKTKTLQSIQSHFGMGTFTVQMPYQIRTPQGVNLFTINPPNYYIDGIYHMSGVIETDNLRRDFTYNLRLTRPNYCVRVNKGDFIGCFIPYQRHFIDKFCISSVVDATSFLSKDIIEEERKCSKDFGAERSQEDIHKKNGNGKRYWRGEDVYGNKFADHQTHLDKN